MLRKPVKSSSLNSIGYSIETQTLEAEFSDGSVYEYYRVPSSVHQALMSASSHGKYFDAHVKKAGFEYRQIK